MTHSEIARFGTARSHPDSAGRTAVFGVMGISDDAETLTVRYEATEGAQPQEWISRVKDSAHLNLPRSVFASIKYTRYDGAENATLERVVHYLLTNHHDKLGRPFTLHYLRSIVTGSPDLIEAEKMLSFAHYPGNKIADKLHFQWIDDADTDNPDSDEDN